MHELPHALPFLQTLQQPAELVTGCHSLAESAAAASSPRLAAVIASSSPNTDAHTRSVALIVASTRWLRHGAVGVEPRVDRLSAARAAVFHNEAVGAIGAVAASPGWRLALPWRRRAEARKVRGRSTRHPEVAQIPAPDDNSQRGGTPPCVTHRVGLATPPASAPCSPRWRTPAPHSQPRASPAQPWRSIRDRGHRSDRV